MTKRFRNYLKVGRPFYFLRLGTSVLVGIIYILLAAAIQYLFVEVFGENTFNYIVGGLMSLFIGVIFCHYIGALVFMFVKGWHVSALAYAPKIQRSGASALDVGIRAFNKNLISFGAVYAVRNIMNNLLVKFKDRLWELFGDNPFAQTFAKISTNPIVEYLASDILHYGFDATIFYIVRHPADDINDVPAQVLTAVKKYLYCLPGIMLTSLQTFVLFRLIPKILKWIAIIYVFLSQGLIAGILLSVLMYPVFYILENALFDPLMMTMFMATYAKKCDEDVSEDDPIVVAVNSILEEDSIGEENGEPIKDSEFSTKPTVKRSKQGDDHEAIQTTITSEEELGLQVDEEARPASTIAEQLSSFANPELSEDTPLEIDEETSSAPLPASLADIARGGLNAIAGIDFTGLDEDPLSGGSKDKE